MDGHTHRATGRYWGCLPPLVMMLCVLIALSIGYFRLEGWLPVGRFDAELWKQGETSDGSGGYVRLQMIYDLDTNGRLNGLTRDEVLALLGPPTVTDKFTEWDLVYWLGPNRGLLRIDSEWLVIQFGSSGTVSKYAVVFD